MSSRGPSSSSRNKKRQAQRGMAVLNLSDLMQNPALGNGIIDPTLITLLGQAGKMATLAQEFANTAKVHDPELRHRNVAAYFEKHHAEIDGSFQQFVRSLDSLDELNAIPYDHMASVLENLDKQAEALKNLDDEHSQKDYAALCAVIKQKNKECVQLLLVGCQKINVWHALLTHYLPRFQSAEIQPSLILSKMFTDYSKATSYLVRRLLTSRLGEHDYYTLYQILSEKFQWLEGLIEFYHKDPVPSITEDILICLQNAACFRLAFLELEKAQQIKALNVAFCESLKPITDEIVSRQERVAVAAALEKHDAMLSMTEEIQKNIWISTFTELNDYLENQINVTPSQPLSLGGFKDKLTQLSTELTIATERQYPELAQEWVKRLLELTIAYSMIDEAQKTADNQKLLFKTALMVLTYYKTKEPTMTSSYLGHCVIGALKALTEKILQSSRTALSTPVVVPTKRLSTVDSSAVASSESSAIVDSLPASSSEPSTVLTEKLATLSLDDAPTKSKVHEQEHQAIMAEHEAALRDSHEQSEKEKQQLVQKLSEQQQELAELRQRLQQELAAEQKKLEVAKQKYIEKRTKKITSKKQQLTQAHQVQLDELRKKQAAEIKLLKTKEQNEIEALQSKQKAELEYLEKTHRQAQQQQASTHQKTLSDLNEQQHQALKALHVQQSAENKAIAKRFEDELTALKNSYQAEYKALDKQQFSHQQAMTSTHHAAIESIKAANRRATDGCSPIATIEIPTEIRFIMLDLADAGIEAYIVGGYVRDRLLGMRSTLKDDFDIIINASPDKLPAKFKRLAQQNPFETCQYKLGSMDLWCKPWSNLTEALQERDLTINTFISDLDGHVFDMLNHAKDLKSRFLHLMGDLEKRFLKDPSLIMRLLRFSAKLNKAISQDDLKIIYQCATYINTLASGIYFKNIEYLFVSHYSNLHLRNMLNSDLLRFIFPGIVKPFSDSLRSSALTAFWAHKLHAFSIEGSVCNYYHVLALFMLQPLLRNPLPNKDLSEQLNHHIDQFFEQYQGVFSDPDKSTFRHRISAIVLSKIQPENPLVGLYEDFVRFEGAWLVEQQRLSAMYRAAYTPQFAAQRAPEIATTLPVVDLEKVASSHKAATSNTL